MLETVLTTDTTVPIPEGFNADCKIINNSGVDVMVLDGHSSDTATEILFEQQSLKVLTTSNGSSIIKNGETAAVQLYDTYTDDDGVLQYSTDYNLIIVQAANLFPVKVVSKMADYINYDYADITIAAADLTAMQESQKFQQSLQAYPDSILATNFLAATGTSLNTSDTDTDIDSKVDAFFQSTENYKDVTLNSLTAIQTYWAAYPYIWAGYAAGKSYYLYSSDGTTASYVGSLNITAPATAPASVDKSLPGFTLNFSPADGSSPKPLKYINGQFVDSVETTTVALKGIYQLKSQFTNVATDNVITAFLSGSANGAKVIGYNEKLTKDSKGNWSGFYTLLHPKDAAGWMTLILEIGAVAMTLELFSRPLKYLKDKFLEAKAKNKGADPSKAEADQMRADAKTKQAQDATEAQRTMDRMGPDITIKIDITVNNSITQLQTDRDIRVTEDSRSNLMDITIRQMDSINKLSQYSMDPTIETMAGKAGSNKRMLDPARTDTATLKEQLPTVKENAASVHITLPNEAIKLQTKTTTAEKTSIAEATEANAEALKQQEELEKARDTSDYGDSGDVEMTDLGGGARAEA